MSYHNGMFPPQLAFGSGVYLSDGIIPEANVEIGVRDADSRYFVCSSTNGLHWAVGNSVDADWASADVRMRSAAGEFPKTASIGRSEECDPCHAGGLTLILP